MTLEKELTYEGQTCFLGSWDWAGTGSTCVCWCLGGGGLTKVQGHALGCPASIGSFSNPCDSLSLGFCSLLEFALTTLQLIAE